MDDKGYHNLWDIVLNDGAILTDEDALNYFFYTAIESSGFKIIEHVTHKFTSAGEGVTGLFLLSESHLSFHTYPETNYISVDVYTCGKNATEMHHNIENFFKNSRRIIFRSIERGSHIKSHYTD